MVWHVVRWLARICCRNPGAHAGTRVGCESATGKLAIGKFQGSKYAAQVAALGRVELHGDAPDSAGDNVRPDPLLECLRPSIQIAADTGERGDYMA